MIYVEDCKRPKKICVILTFMTAACRSILTGDLRTFAMLKMTIKKKVTEIKNNRIVIKTSLFTGNFDFYNRLILLDTKE